jgi:hypothetical protein
MPTLTTGLTDVSERDNRERERERDGVIKKKV